MNTRSIPKKQGGSLLITQHKSWKPFQAEYTHARTNKNTRLFRPIIDEYRRLVDKELGTGVFARFQANQRGLREYQNSRPQIEFYVEGGFLLTRAIKSEQAREESLRKKILQERLEKDGAFELRAKVAQSQARQEIRKKYGTLIDLLIPTSDVRDYVLNDENAEALLPKDAARLLFQQMADAKRQRKTEALNLCQKHLPEMYKAFTTLFQETVSGQNL